MSNYLHKRNFIKDVLITEKFQSLEESLFNYCSLPFLVWWTHDWYLETSFHRFLVFLKYWHISVKVEPSGLELAQPHHLYCRHSNYKSGWVCAYWVHIDKEVVGVQSEVSQYNFIKNEWDVCFLQCSIQNSSGQFQAGTVFMLYHADLPLRQCCHLFYKNGKLFNKKVFKIQQQQLKTPFCLSFYLVH